MTFQSVAKEFIPPVMLRWRRRPASKGLRCHGRPASWADALAQSTGYESDYILERVIAASRAVVRGDGAFDRDSVVFSEPAVPFPVVAGILRSAVRDGGRARVIDVGGALGSTYRQCRAFLGSLGRLEWHVVEQSAYVAAGRAEFESEELRFHESAEEIPFEGVPITFLLSAVLQYLEDPVGTLLTLPARPARHLILDRTAVSAAGSDRLCIQDAPASVYQASYPAWIFSRALLRERLAEHWHLIADELGSDGEHVTEDGLAFEYRTMTWERKP